MRSPVVAALWAVLLGAWILLSRPEAPAAETNALAVLAALAGFIGGLVTARFDRRLAALVVPAATIVAFVLSAPVSFSHAPVARPTGYANANGELLLAACAGCLLCARAAGERWRWPLVGAAVIAGGMCGVVHAQASGACCLGLIVWFVLSDRGDERIWAWGSVAVVLAAIGVTFLLGLGVGLVPESLAEALSAQRRVLWGDALQILAAHPWTGAGAGTFPLLSPTARNDSDLAWTHSAPLQVAAEQGYVGLALLLGLFVWTILMLRRSAPVAALLLLPTTIDYVLDFGWVLAAVGFVLGVAVSGATEGTGTGKPWLTPPSP